jgi:hypothetical protein
MTNQHVRCIGSMTTPSGAGGRICVVCHHQLPDGQGIDQVHPGVLTHQESCNAVIAGLDRIPGHRPQARKRPLGELMALASGARCEFCEAENRRGAPGAAGHVGKAE